MKNKFLGFIILGATLFAACNDDDDDKRSATYNGANLKVTVSGMALSNKEAVLDGNTLTVKNTIPGETEVAFPVEFAGDNMTGTNTGATRNIDLQGSINADTLNLALSMDVKHKMANRWALDSIYLTITMTDTASMENKMAAQMIQALIPALNKGGILKNLVNYLDLQKNGQIIANYPENGTAVNSPENMALYNVANDQLYVALDLASIIADAQKDATTENPATMSLGRADNNPLLGIMGALGSGFPLQMKDNGSDGVLVYLTKEAVDPILALVPTLLAGLDADLSGMEDTINGVVNLLLWSKDYQIGIYLGPYSEASTPETTMSAKQNLQELVRSLQF